MKDRYFGDINDYYKYGLIRGITGLGQLSCSICWMLTHDDGRQDGGKLDYLLNPNVWRDFDWELFDILRYIVVVERKRGVRYAKERKLIPSASYYEELLTDNRQLRKSYMERFTELSSGARLIFYDPDNGMEVPSVPPGRKNSSKYLYWSEIRDFPHETVSILVYQHFPRVERERFIDQLVNRFMTETLYSDVFSFRTANVVFFLLAAKRDLSFFEEKSSSIAITWNGKMKIDRYLDA